MCALICMAVYSTEENKKDECLAKTLKSLDETVNFKKHRLMLSVNGSTEITKRIIHNNRDIIEQVIWNDENLGTAEAINKLFRLRKPGEHAIKCDDDYVVHSSGWVDEMEEVISRDPSIGQVGLKRKDCIENPKHENPYFRSEIQMLPQIPGQRWIIVEKCSHVMGTCVMHSSALLDKVISLYQPDLYGFDDVLMSKRSIVAGFKNVFIPHINIDHIDDGSTPYQSWKERTALAKMEEINRIMKGYEDGSISIVYPFK